MLAPVYNRLAGCGTFEAAKTSAWSCRSLALGKYLKSLGSDIFCLQELWISNETAVDLIKQELTGYDFVTQKRHNKKKDGIGIAFSNRFELVNFDHVAFGEVGDRVALLAHLRSEEVNRELIVATTHLTFPHHSFDFLLRAQQAESFVDAVDKFCIDSHVGKDCPVVLSGDFNGVAPNPSVIDDVRHRWWRTICQDGGFHSAYYEANGKHPSATHITHNNDILGVDHVFVRGQLDVENCFLEPRNVCDDSVLYRPNVCVDGKDPDECIHELERLGSDGNKFASIWQAFSDHRPITIQFGLETQS